MTSRSGLHAERVYIAPYSVKASERDHFLVRWQTKPKAPIPPRAICSWHDISELTRCLHLVQKYLDASAKPSRTLLKPPPLPNRKRKSPESEPWEARDSAHGPITTSSSSSRASSESTTTPSSFEGAHSSEPDIYNGVLETREGWIVAKKSKGDDVPQINAASLPTQEMLQRAASTPFTQAEIYIRRAFEMKLTKFRGLRLENQFDSSTPSLDFTFISESVIGKDVYPADPETLEGCADPCRPNMGNHIGCEWPRQCKCLELAAVDEKKLELRDPEAYKQYRLDQENNVYIDTSKYPKQFPYQRSTGVHHPQTLVTFYREARHEIYECNPNCNCGPGCKTRVVQKGRKVPLVIFKTANRGWGVKCDEDLLQGEFIDTYRGEIITNKEADRREALGSKDKQSYLYSLDKFVGIDPDLAHDNCYVVDGQFVGGATRFINHSCDPNCRQYVVSYNKHDRRVYQLAFFAYCNIPAGTELTFDYQDKDPMEDDEAIAMREAAFADPKNAGKPRCRCGAKACRGYLWD